MFSLVIEVNINGLFTKLTINKTCHHGLFVKLSHLAPGHLCKLLLGLGGRILLLEVDIISSVDPT